MYGNLFTFCLNFLYRKIFVNKKASSTIFLNVSLIKQGDFPFDEKTKFN